MLRNFSKMSYFLSVIYLILMLDQLSQAKTVPQELRTKADIADLRVHGGNVDSKSEKVQIKRDGENENDFWLKIAKDFVGDQLTKRVNTNKAKNVIFFLADGMSVSTYNAARVAIGGEEKSMSFESFPHVGMVKTYCTDFQVPDSACTSTAYLNGVKANEGTAGVTAKVRRGHCTDQLDVSTHTESIFKWALDSRKSAGLVTTDVVTGASPAGVFAHIAERNWHNDVDVRGNGCDPNETDDMSKQLVRSDVGSRLQVILGGGRANMRNNTVLDEEGVRGRRADGLDLIQEYLDQKVGSRVKYVWNATDFRSIDANEVDYLLGLFEGDTMMYNRDLIDNGYQNYKPTLSEMTAKAIDVLSKNENGYFLFVENQKVDTAHHSNYGRLALDETVEFSKAIELARNKVNEEDTLIVVTSDHSHTMSYSGYGARGSDIYNAAERSNIDGKPYMKLMYANGPGYPNHMSASEKTRIDLSKIDATSSKFMFPAAVPIVSETHGGDDVAVFAVGPWAHIFSGLYEQYVIPYLIAHASCVGTGLSHSCT